MVSKRGVKTGYNPQKPGRGSHHPLLAFVSDCRMVANMWLRSGNAHTANNLFSFPEDTIEKLQGKRIGLLRADSGFYGEDIFNYLERQERTNNYIIAARLYKPVQMTIARNHVWLKIDDGIEVADTEYQSLNWYRSRRMIIVCQTIKERPHASGKKIRLFKEQGIYKTYRYHCFITNLTLPAEHVWNLYKHRAEAENRIKELKYDFGFDSFNIKSFYGTEAALNMAMMAYNLMSLFRQAILGQKQQPRVHTSVQSICNWSLHG